jgi:hypothetical protein
MMIVLLVVTECQSTHPVTTVDIARVLPWIISPEAPPSQCQPLGLIESVREADLQDPSTLKRIASRARQERANYVRISAQTPGANDLDAFACPEKDLPDRKELPERWTPVLPPKTECYLREVSCSLACRPDDPFCNCNCANELCTCERFAGVSSTCEFVACGLCYGAISPLGFSRGQGCTSSEQCCGGSCTSGAGVCCAGGRP